MCLFRIGAVAWQYPGMTTIEIPTTEKMNGSTRMTAGTDSPWWNVRPLLAASLAGSLAITVSAFHFAGLTPAAWTLAATLCAAVLVRRLLARLSARQERPPTV